MWIKCVENVRRWLVESWPDRTWRWPLHLGCVQDVSEDCIHQCQTVSWPTVPRPQCLVLSVITLASYIIAPQTISLSLSLIRSYTLYISRPSVQERFQAEIFGGSDSNQIEATKAQSGERRMRKNGWIGKVPPPQTTRRSRERRKLPSGVWDGAPAGNES